MKNLLLIIISILSGLNSSLRDDISIIKDIEYSKEYELDSSIFTEKYIDLYFRLPLPSSRDNIGITLKAFTNEGEYFVHPRLNLYAEKPDDNDIKNSDKSNWDFLTYKYTRKYKIYSYFTYVPNTIGNEEYAVIYVSTTEKLKYFSILADTFRKRTDILAASLTFNKEYKIESDKLSYTYTYFNFVVEAENHDKNESIIIVLSENDVNDLEFDLEGKNQKIGPASGVIKSFNNYTSYEKKGDLIEYKYNYGQISSEHKFLSMIIKSKDGYMLNYFSIQVGNYEKFISFELISLIGILLFMI